MNVNLFNEPSEHPFGMLDGYTHAMEKETVLAWMLCKCIDAGEWIAVLTTHAHPTMVEDGLLEKDVARWYRLTAKAKDLLYGYFAKEK